MVTTTAAARLTPAAHASTQYDTNEWVSPGQLTVKLIDVDSMQQVQSVRQQWLPHGTSRSAKSAFTLRNAENLSCSSDKQCPPAGDVNLRCVGGSCVLDGSPEAIAVNVFCRDVLRCVLGPRLAEAVCARGSVAQIKDELIKQVDSLIVH
jgi:hypothetical protein